MTDPDITNIDIRLFGTPTIMSNGKALKLRSRKAMALLAYLAVRADEQVARSHLAGLLWGDNTEEQARANLRQTLSQLRKPFREAGHDPIHVPFDQVILNARGLAIDVQSFVDESACHTLETLSALPDFLEGFSVRAPDFDHWLTAQRQQLRTRKRQKSVSLAERAEARGRIDEALDCLTLAVRIDPLQEELHRRLMRLFAGQGRTDAALAQYDTCSRILRSELDVEPEAETRNLSAEIRKQRSGTAAPRRVDENEALDEAGTNHTLALPDKPSIAVLPFDNLSGDPEQDYFSNGIAEDIITQLSRFRSIFVIARNSSFAYQGTAVSVRNIGENLGAQYLVEGSVRKAGNRVRITAQLVEVATGHEIWADRYDRDLDDIFAVQDEVTQTIVATLPRRMEAADLERVKRKPPENMAAHDYVLRGKDHHHRFTKEDNAKGLQALETAVELDPEYAQAHAWLSCTLGQASIRGYGKDSRALWRRCVEEAETAISLDEDDSDCHWLLCELSLTAGHLDRAEIHHEKAHALNSNDPRIVVQRGYLLTWLGRPDEGVEWINKVMRLDPYHAEGYCKNLGIALYVARRYSEAVDAFKRIPVPDSGHLAYMAACYSQMGRNSKANSHAARVLEMKPDFSASKFLDTIPYKNRIDREHHREGLLNAGLPE